MDSIPTIKKPRELKQKAQAPIGQAGRVHTNTEVISERPGGRFKLPPAKLMQSLHYQEPSHLWE